MGWQKVDKSEWETLFTWDRDINSLFKVFAGVDLIGVRSELRRTGLCSASATCCRSTWSLVFGLIRWRCEVQLVKII